MAGETTQDNEPKKKSKRVGLASVLALTVGGLFAGLTLSIEQLAAPPTGILIVLLVPGLLGSMAISNNVHAFHLWIAALINGLIYFGLTWVIYRLIRRFVRR